MGVRAVLTGMAVKELIRSKSFLTAFVVIAFFLVAVLDFLGIRLWLLPLLHSRPVDLKAVPEAAGGIVYVTVLVVTGLFLAIGSAQPLVRAKASGSFESLLATPATSRDVWFAFSAASTLPGILAGVLCGSVTAAVLGLWFLAPEGVKLLTSPWLILNCFLLIPAVYLLLGFLVHLIGVTGNPVSGNAVAQVFLPGWTSLVINLGVRDTVGADRWDLSAVQFGMAIVLAVLVALLRGRVTKQRIVLSCRR